MSDLVPCLVVNSRGEWRVEERPPIAPRIPPEHEWSSVPSASLFLAQKYHRRSKVKEAAE